MILADRDIKKLVFFDGMDFGDVGTEPLIDPFQTHKIGSPSYGLSSHGYDVRLGTEFLEVPSILITPGESPPFYQPIEIKQDDRYYLQPGGFILACSHEKICLPPDITGLVKDKSSYARLGISVQNTVLEAGWEGIITLEISNHGPAEVPLLPGKGIAQILFFRSETGCDAPYSGKYQGDMTVATSK